MNMEKFGRYMITLLLVVANVYLVATAIALLWGWFIVPLGVASISMVHAYGLSIIVGFMTTGVSDLTKANNDPKDLNNKLAMKVVISLSAMLGGWVTFQFM